MSMDGIDIVNVFLAIACMIFILICIADAVNDDDDWFER